MKLHVAHMTSHDTGGQDSSEQILKQLEDAPLQREIQPGVVVNLEEPSEYGEYLLLISIGSNASNVQDIILNSFPCSLILTINTIVLNDNILSTIQIVKQ